MSDTPTKSDRLTPHERRARVIAQMHLQAVRTAEFRASQRRAFGTKIVRGIQKRTKTWLLVAGLFAFLFACICALIGMVALAL